MCEDLCVIYVQGNVISNLYVWVPADVHVHVHVYLDLPQPLKDNLDSATYEVFEKDPVKYISYEKVCTCIYMYTCAHTCTCT